MNYRDRQGNSYIIDTTQDKVLRLLYNHTFGRIILGRLITPGFSNFLGRLYNSPISRLTAKRYAKRPSIKMEDFENRKFTSFNDFFTRKLRPGARTFDLSASAFISPADSRLSVYPISDKLVMNIKGSSYSIKSLTLSADISAEFAGGYCLIFRLTPDDYHRYIFIDDGEIETAIHIDGMYHTVNPVVMEHANVYYENVREYMLINSKHLGRIVQMEVGALGVGRIVNTIAEGRVAKGQEKGYFEFGGSTIVVMVKKDAVVLDSDLLKNTEEGFETLVKVGERLGTVNRKS